MMHQFDHRWATYEPDGTVRDVTLAEKRDPSFSVLPRYWVQREHVAEALKDRWDKTWLLGWRDIARATDERTAIATLIPRAGIGNNLPLFSAMKTTNMPLLVGAWSSLAMDFAARLKVGGTHLNFFIVQQLPVPAPEVGQLPTPWDRAVELTDWIRDRTAELSSTANDLPLDGNGPPFTFEPERRSILRAELDAAYFHLYGLDRTEAEYVLGTFPIVRRKDEGTYGEYRTKRLILEAYDAMTTAIANGTTFRSTLTPPPGHGPRHPEKEREAALT